MTAARRIAGGNEMTGGICGERQQIPIDFRCIQNKYRSRTHRAREVSLSGQLFVILNLACLPAPGIDPLS